MTVTYTIPSSQSFAVGDCINVNLAANPYLSSVTPYVPFTDTSSCQVKIDTHIKNIQIQAGPSLASCNIPQSAGSNGQQIQLVSGGTASSRNFIGLLKLNNPFSQRPLTFTVGFMKSCTGSLLGPQTSLISFTTGNINQMLLSSNSAIIGDVNCVLTVKFQIGTSMRTQGRIALTVPRLYNPGDGSIIPVIDSILFQPQVTSASDSTTRSITVTSRSFDPNTLVLIVDYTISSTYNSGQWVQFSVSNFANPINYSPLSGFLIQTYEVQNSGSFALIDTTPSGTIYSLTFSNPKPQSMSNGVVQLWLNAQTSNYQIAQPNRNISFSFDVALPLEQTCYLKINFPNEIMINIDSLITSVSGDDFMSDATISSNLSFGSGNSLTISGCNSIFNGYSHRTNIVISTVVSPGQIKDVTGFSLQLAKDAGMTQILATGNNQQGFMIPRGLLIGGTISSMQFKPSNNPFGSNIVQETSEYTAVFQLVSNLYSNSVIEITLPPLLTGLSSNPTCSVEGYNTNSNPTCAISITGNSVLVSQAFLDNSIPSAGWDFNPPSSQKIVTVRIRSANNPTSSKPAQGWKVTTYNQINGTIYQVDTGTSLTSFTPLSGQLSKYSNIVVDPPQTNFQSSTYKFFIQLQHSIPSQGKIILTVPQNEIRIQSSTIKSSCLYFPPGSTSSPQPQVCTAIGNNITMQLFASHSSSNILQIQFQGFQNPRTMKQTSSFIISTLDKDDTLIDNSTTSPNFNVQMTTLASLLDMSVTASNLTNGANTFYIVSFSSPIALINGDKILMNLDSRIMPFFSGGQTSGTVSCTGGLQISQLSCQYANNLLTVTLTNVQSQVGTYSFNLTQMLNPPSTKQYNFVSSTIFTDQNNNQVMSLQNKNVNIQTTLPANILKYGLTQSRLDHGTPAVYTITFQTTNPISNQGSIVITWPIQVSLPSDGSSVQCQVQTSQLFTRNCNFSSSTRTITIIGVFQNTFFGTITIVLSSMINPADNRAVNGFQIATYDDTLQTFKIDKLDDNLMVPQTLCNFPCKTCTTLNRNYCQSCWSDIGSPFLQTYNSSVSRCQQSCILGFTTNGDINKKCVACDPSCSQCVDNSQVGDKFKCITCAAGYNYQYTPAQKCMTSCSNEFYESSPFMCNYCSAQCLTCSKLASNCTSCSSLIPQHRYLFKSQCIDSCPTGYIPLGTECVKCDPKCLTCSNSTTTCTACDISTNYKYLFGLKCLDVCPSGTQPDNQKLQCIGCLKGCKICDSRNQTNCLECESPLLQYQGSCYESCPAGTSVNFFGTSCSTYYSFDFPTIPYPHLMACGAMLLIAFISEITDRRAHFVSTVIVLFGPIEMVSYFSLTFFSVLFQTYKFAAASALSIVSYFLLNITFALLFEVRIARKDLEYMQWRTLYPKTSRIIVILSAILSFKILRLHYSFFFGLECFKAPFNQGGVFQRQIIISTIVHFILSSCIIIGVDIVGLTQLQWGTQLTITMQETAVMAVIMIIFDFIELCKLKHYLGEDQRVDYEALLNQMNESMDKKLRQDMLKQIMNHVKGNKDLRLNNRFDELLTENGPRRCQSMIEFGNNLEDDPRKTKTAPTSPRRDDTLFDGALPTIDNVYAESKPADPLGKLGKTYSDFDSQVFPNQLDKILQRKGGDYIQFSHSTLDGGYKRIRKNKARGRKNQYYAQIDLEDDEEADNLNDDIDKDLNDLDVIKEDEEVNEEELKKLKKEQKRLKALQEEQEKMRQRKEQEAKEQEILKQQQQLEELMKKEQLEKERQEREALEKLHAEQEVLRQSQLQKLELQKLELEKKKELERQREQQRQKEEEKEKEEEKRRKLQEAVIAEQQMREAAEKQEQQRKEEEKLAEERIKKQEEELRLLEEKKQLEEAKNIAASPSKQIVPASPNLSDIQMNSHMNLQQFQIHPIAIGDEPILQVPPDASKRTFNEQDILGDLDRDEKGNLIIQDSGFDKQGRKVNERGYLINPTTGDIIENLKYEQKMFSQKDLDERGEIPVPFCLEKHNFNPFLCRGDFDPDRTGRPLLQKRGIELIDKRGRLVNKKGWLIDKAGNIVDWNGRKKFDRKQLTEEGDLPRLFNLNGRRFDVTDVCGQLSRDEQGHILFKRDKKNQLVDNQGKLVNERGYLIDEYGNIIDRERKRLFEKRFLKNGGEFPKIFPFTKFSIKRILGNFEMDPLGNPILEKNGTQLIDRDGAKVNIRGYFIDSQGNIVDKNGRIMFEADILDKEGDIPKVFRTGLLKTDSAGSSMSRLMSEIERNQPSEYGNPQWRRIQQKEERKIEEEKRRKQEQDEILERHSGNTSVDSMMEDTPSNYNIANQRFEHTSEALNKKSQQLQQVNFSPSLQQQQQQKITVDEAEDDSQLEGDQTYSGRNLAQERRQQGKKKKTMQQTYGEPSEKDIMMAKAYGGIPRGQAKRPQNIQNSNRNLFRESSQTPASTINRGSRTQVQKIAGTVSGYQRDRLHSRGASMNNADFIHVSSTPGIGLPQGESNEASFVVQDHHIREQRLKRQKMSELRNKSRLLKKRAGATGDPDFERMFGKDIDEFLENSDWDIESFDNMSQFSKGTSRSAFHDGRIRGLENIYLQRIESGMKGGAKGIQSRKNSKKPTQTQNKFRPPFYGGLMNNNQDSNNILPQNQGAEEKLSGGVNSSNISHSRMINRPQFIESANTTGVQMMRTSDNNINRHTGPPGIPKPVQVQTQYRQQPKFM